MIQRPSKMTQHILILHLELLLDNSCSMTHVLRLAKAFKAGLLIARNLLLEHQEFKIYLTILEKYSKYQK